MSNTPPRRSPQSGARPSGPHRSASAEGTADSSPSVSDLNVGPIVVRGARSHNLQGVDVDFPRGQLTVVTGVSGSGKSSLALDTLAAEGRRRYLEALSFSAGRTWPEPRVAVEQIEDLPPVIAIEQQSATPRQRATVASVSEVADFVRVLFARFGTALCPTCRQAVVSSRTDDIIARVMDQPERTKVLVLAPLVVAEEQSPATVFAEVMKQGFVRVRLGGVLHEVSAPPPAFPAANSTDRASVSIEVVIDRLMVKAGIESRLSESLASGWQVGAGLCVVAIETATGWSEELHSLEPRCPGCRREFPPLGPRTFSDLSSRGACEHCAGRGTIASATGDYSTCPDCSGTRLNAFSRSVTLAGTTYPDWMSQPVQDLLGQVQSLRQTVESSTANWAPLNAHRAATRLLIEIEQRLTFLRAVGLGYLQLSRPANTLSHGELRRTRLAAHLAAELADVCYVIDEPTAGLHPHDTSSLFELLEELRHRGNTVIVVEHDLALIRRADYVIELGPGAGRDGGRITAVGTPASLATNPASVTGPWLGLPLSASLLADDQAERPSIQTGPPQEWLRIEGGTAHNIRNLSVSIPLQCLTCVTGVSGSGKSTLVRGILGPLMQAAVASRGRQPPAGSVSPLGQIVSGDEIDRVVCITDQGLPRSSRATVATALELWDPLRHLFAKTKEARRAGLTPAHFNPRHPESGCETCLGRGVVSIDPMLSTRRDVRKGPSQSSRGNGTASHSRRSALIEPVEVRVCPACHGQRWGPRLLSIRYRGLNLADVLKLTLTAAAEFFQNFSRLHQRLERACSLGLGYLQLGQLTVSLSGGEAQRVLLARDLISTLEARRTLYLLDEPASGLHPRDMLALVRVLRALRDAGNTIVVVEHQLPFVAAADWVIDLGPGAGPAGGQVVATGPVTAIRSSATSVTGQALRQLFGE